MCSTCLLQVLDDGRLTDSKGRTVAFKNTVIIMTSNTGAHLLTSAWAESADGFEDVKARVMDELRKQFRPEFLNRVDDIVIFHPLGEEQLTHIVDLRLKDLQRLLSDRKITLEPDGSRTQAAVYRRLRPRLRCQASQACHPAHASGSIGAAHP